MVSSRAAKPALSPLAVARQDLDAARLRVQEVAARKLVALQESDDAWSAWGRQRELADADVSRLTELVARLEAEAESEAAKTKRDGLLRRYEAVAAQNAAAAELIRTEMPKAWSIIETVLEAVALADIATKQLAADLPHDFDTGDLWIGNPERETRCRPPCDQKILSRKRVDLWCDPKTGNRFVDQSKPPTVTATKRPFMEITYQPFVPANDVPPLYRTLKIPRLNATGPAFLFDGPTLNSPGDVLAALRRARERVAHEVPVLVRHEPLDAAGNPIPAADISPPPIFS